LTVGRSDAEAATIWTIGHSTHSYERFVELLRAAGITAIADVRTAPYSRHFPQFSQDALKKELRLDGIAYSYLGDELGGRPKSSRFYCDGVADYEKMALVPEFSAGLDRVVAGSKTYRIALMCSEQDPLDCHRCLLVGRALAERDVPVMHIMGDGSALSQDDVEKTLLKLSSSDNSDLFLDAKGRRVNAYRARSMKVAYAEPRLAKNA
jgi:uncharacterized protein (DUF488 family)